VSSRDTNNVIIVNTDATRTLSEVFESDIILVDTGCSHHMANHPSYVRDFKENNAQLSPSLGTVVMGNGSTAVISGYGTKWPFGRVLIVPTLSCKVILSVGMLESLGYSFVFEGGGFNMVNNRSESIIYGTRTDRNLYRVTKIIRDREAWHDTSNTSLPSVSAPAQCNVTINSSPKGSKTEAKSTSEGNITPLSRTSQTSSLFRVFMNYLLE